MMFVINALRWIGEFSLFNIGHYFDSDFVKSDQSFNAESSYNQLSIAQLRESLFLCAISHHSIIKALA